MQFKNKKQKNGKLNTENMRMKPFPLKVDEFVTKFQFSSFFLPFLSMRKEVGTNKYIHNF